MRVKFGQCSVTILPTILHHLDPLDQILGMPTVVLVNSGESRSLRPGSRAGVVGYNRPNIS